MKVVDRLWGCQGWWGRQVTIDGDYLPEAVGQPEVGGAISDTSRGEADAAEVSSTTSTLGCPVAQRLYHSNLWFRDLVVLGLFPVFRFEES